MADQWDSEKIYDDQGNFVFVGDLSPEDRLRVTRSSYGTFLVSSDAANEAERLAELGYVPAEYPVGGSFQTDADDYDECANCNRFGCKGQCQ